MTAKQERWAYDSASPSPRVYKNSVPEKKSRRGQHPEPNERRHTVAREDVFAHRSYRAYDRRKSEQTHQRPRKEGLCHTPPFIRVLFSCALTRFMQKQPLCQIGSKHSRKKDSHCLYPCLALQRIRAKKWKRTQPFTFCLLRRVSIVRSNAPGIVRLPRECCQEKKQKNTERDTTSGIPPGCPGDSVTRQRSPLGAASAYWAAPGSAAWQECKYLWLRRALVHLGMALRLAS